MKWRNSWVSISQESRGVDVSRCKIFWSRFELLVLSIDSKRRGGFKRVGSATKDITHFSKICSLNIKIVLFTGTGGVYSGVYPWFVSSVFFSKFSSLNYTGWLTLDERAFARLYPGNHEVAKHLGRRRKSEAIYEKKLHVPRLFYKIALRVAWQANRLISRSARRRGGQESIELLSCGLRNRLD